MITKKEETIKCFVSPNILLGLELKLPPADTNVELMNILSREELGFHIWCGYTSDMRDKSYTTNF